MIWLQVYLKTGLVSADRGRGVSPAGTWANMEREARNVRAKQEQGTERKKMCQSSVLKETENKYDKVTMRNRMHIRHVAWGGGPPYQQNNSNNA